jgi:hypothetical protein
MGFPPMPQSPQTSRRAALHLLDGQFGGAVQLQTNLARYLIGGSTLQDIARRGLLYGILGRFTLAAVLNQNTTVTHESVDYISKLELIYQF